MFVGKSIISIEYPGNMYSFIKSSTVVFTGRRDFLLTPNFSQQQQQTCFRHTAVDIVMLLSVKMDCVEVFVICMCTFKTN